MAGAVGDRAGEEAGLIMRAAGLDYQHRQLTEGAVPEPRLESDDGVLFRVHEVGVCGTDRELAAFSLGYPPEGESFLALGHEALGRVEETGPAVTTLRRGDWVAPSIRRPCRPPCASCARGRRDLCLTEGYRERGIFGLHGYFTDYAVDAAADLVRVPEELVDVAVLIEPLSVVEKAVERALRLAEAPPVTALVLGAGPIGILAALSLQARGLEVSLASLEPPQHPRARLVQQAGIRYLSAPDSKADVIVEATGSAEAAFKGLRWLAPLGVCALLGAANALGEAPFLDLIVNNQVVFGSVNASPDSFALAVEDLKRFDRGLLRRMIRRAGRGSYRETIPAPPGEAAKIVHVMAE